MVLHKIEKFSDIRKIPWNVCIVNLTIDTICMYYKDYLKVNELFWKQDNIQVRDRHIEWVYACVTGFT